MTNKTSSRIRPAEMEAHTAALEAALAQSLATAQRYREAIAQACADPGLPSQTRAQLAAALAEPLSLEPGMTPLALLLTNMDVSVDVSTGDHDHTNRVFAQLTGETGSDGRTWLAIENSRNFGGTGALRQAS